MTFALTNDNQYKQEGGHSCRDVEHDSDVSRQLIQIVHIWNQYWWN